MENLVKLPSTPAPYLLLENSQRVATTVVSEVALGIFKPANSHPLNATFINSTFAFLIFIPSAYSLGMFQGKYSKRRERASRIWKAL